MFSTVAPSQSPSLPHSNSHGGSGIFSFSPANMVHAVKQKSAFFPVMRPGSGYSPPMASTLPNGWAQTMINVSIFSYKSFSFFSTSQFLSIYKVYHIYLFGKKSEGKLSQYFLFLQFSSLCVMNILAACFPFLFCMKLNKYNKKCSSFLISMKQEKYNESCSS